MTKSQGHLARWPRTWLALGLVVSLVAFSLWMHGRTGSHRIGPEDGPRGAGSEPPPPGSTVALVAEITVARGLEAAGTVRSRTEAALAPRIQAVVREVRVDVGDRTEVGQILVRLDSRDVDAKTGQARAAAAAADAEADRITSDARRTEALFLDKAATPQQLDQARSAARSGRAAAEAARHALEEALVYAAEAELRAPFAAVVSERRADPGSLATPGQALLVLIDPASLRVEAALDEEAAIALRVGDPVRVRLAGHEGAIDSTIEDIVPSSDPRTRTIVARAGLPRGLEARPGSFARLELRGAEERAVVIPTAAVRRTGQVETVRIVTPNGIRAVHVRTGRTGLGSEGDLIEVLAGLMVGEQVIVEGPPR